MWVAYYREQGVPNNNFRNNEVALQVNCTGYNLIEERIDASTVRRDHYLFYLHFGEIRIIEPKVGESVMHAGDMIVYDADRPFHYCTENEPPTGHYFVHFTGYQAHELLKQCHIPTDTVCHIEHSKRLISKFYALFDTFRYRDEYFSLDSAQKLTELLITVGRDLTNSKVYHAHKITEKVERSINFLQEHFTENITVEQLARMEFLSPSRYRTLFRDAMQQSPQEYIIKLRLEMACTLLNNTKYSIADTAQSVGYSDPRYFARLFQKHYGMTPTEYRNGG